MRLRKLSLIVSLMVTVTTAYAAVTVTVNGSNYSIPQTNERGWGNAVTAWIQAISANTLQPTGGSFILTSDVDFGSNFGVKSSYLLSRSANLADAGFVRLAKTDSIAWRNNANTNNLLLGIDASDKLTFNGVAFPDQTDIVTLSGTQTLTNKTLTTPIISTISNTGTLSLPTSTDTLVGRSTTDTLTNKSINGSNNTVTNISLTTAVTGTLPLGNGGTGQTTKSAAFDALSPMSASGDIIYGGASGTGTRLAKGTDGQVLTLSSGVPTWGTSLTNPMTTGGDLIYGGASGVPARLSNGTANQVLTSSGGTLAPTWSDNIPQAWVARGYISGSSKSMSSVGSFTEITQTDWTLTPRSNSQAMSILCNSTNSPSSPSTSPTTCPSGTESLGISVNAPYVGWYRICISASTQLAVGGGASNASSVTYDIFETPTNAQTDIQQGFANVRMYASNNPSATLTTDIITPTTQCASMYISSTGQKAFRFKSIVSLSGASLAIVIPDVQGVISAVEATFVGR